MRPLLAQAAAALAIPMAAVERAKHAAFLRAVIDVAAGGLLIIEGPEQTSEALYRADDTVVAARWGEDA